MLEDLFDRDSVGRPQPETPSYEVLALVGQPGAELKVGVADLFVLLKRDVAADHVVEKDAQAPNSGRDSVVSAVANPFWRCVNSGSCKKKKEILL